MVAYLLLLLFMFCLTLFITPQVKTPNSLWCPEEKRNKKVWIRWAWWSAVYLGRLGWVPPHLQMRCDLQLPCLCVVPVEHFSQPNFLFQGHRLLPGFRKCMLKNNIIQVSYFVMLWTLCTVFRSMGELGAVDGWWILHKMIFWKATQNQIPEVECLVVLPLLRLLVLLKLGELDMVLQVEGTLSE